MPRLGLFVTCLKKGNKPIISTQPLGGIFEKLKLTEPTMVLYKLVANPCNAWKNYLKWNLKNYYYKYENLLLLCLYIKYILVLDIYYDYVYI